MTSVDLLEAAAPAATGRGTTRAWGAKACSTGSDALRHAVTAKRSFRVNLIMVKKYIAPRLMLSKAYDGSRKTLSSYVIDYWKTAVS